MTLKRLKTLPIILGHVRQATPAFMLVMKEMLWAFSKLSRCLFIKRQIMRAWKAYISSWRNVTALSDKYANVSCLYGHPEEM
jgi:hypothetical protein